MHIVIELILTALVITLFILYKKTTEELYDIKQEQLSSACKLSIVSDYIITQTRAKTSLETMLKDIKRILNINM